jgi:hypothetical protein
MYVCMYVCVCVCVSVCVSVRYGALLVYRKQPELPPNSIEIVQQPECAFCLCLYACKTLCPRESITNTPL